MLHPNIVAIARLLGRQAATARYIPAPLDIDQMQSAITNDNENVNEAGSDLRAVQ